MTSLSICQNGLAAYCTVRIPTSTTARPECCMDSILTAVAKGKIHLGHFWYTPKKGNVFILKFVQWWHDHNHLPCQALQQRSLLVPHPVHSSVQNPESRFVVSCLNSCWESWFAFVVLPWSPIKFTTQWITAMLMWKPLMPKGLHTNSSHKTCS